jgi:hypothetical protein
MSLCFCNILEVSVEVLPSLKKNLHKCYSLETTIFWRIRNCKGHNTQSERSLIPNTQTQILTSTANDYRYSTLPPPSGWVLC